MPTLGLSAQVTAVLVLPVTVAANWADPPPFSVTVEGERLMDTGAGPEVDVSIWMALTWALFTLAENAMVIAPVVTGTVNDSSSARFSPPAFAKMSKFVSSATLLIVTLNTLAPALAKTISANLRVTV